MAEPVTKQIRVRCSAAHAFSTFIDKIDAISGDLRYSVECATYPDDLFQRLSASPAQAHGTSPLLGEKRALTTEVYWLKRPMDVIGALVALVLFSPLMLFAAIAVLILVAVGVSFMGEMPEAGKDVTSKGGMRLTLNMVIASVQVALLSLIFMHLKKSDNLTWLIVGAGIFWLFILFVLLLTDYVTRQYGVY